MSYPMRQLVVLMAVFLAPPVGAEDKPTAKPANPSDARRAALVRAGYTHVPLTPDPRQLSFFVDGAIGPEKTKFLLDSGSMNTSLDLKLAKRLKLKLGEEAASVGLDGKLAGRRTYVPGLMIGSHDTRKEWPSLPVQAIDLSGHPGSPSGVLGVGVLDMWGAIVDYPARAMYLKPPLANVWPRLAGTWTVTSWLEDGEARKLDPKAPPTFMFANRRLKLTDRGKTREFAMMFAPSDGGDSLLLIDPKDEGKPELEFEGGGLIKTKDGTMTLCLLLDTDKPRGFPREFAAPKGSGYKLLELKHTDPGSLKPPANPLRELLLKEGYTAVQLDRDLFGTRMAAARVGQHDLRLMVDTGMTLTAFDTAGLDKLRAVRMGAREGHALRGKVKGEDVNLRGLLLGGYDTRRTFGVVYGCGFDLAGLNTFFVEQKRRPIQGLLGNLDLLNGSALIDFGTNTLYLRPVKETVGPQLEGKWVGVRYELDGKKGRYAPGDKAVEFKGGRVRFTTPSKTAEWGFHVEDELDLYRVGLFDPGADELADGFRYAGGGLLLRLAGDTLTMVMGEPNEFAAPKGSGLLLVEYERAK